VKPILLLAALVLATASTASAARSVAGVELRVYPAAVDFAETPHLVLVNTGDVVLEYGTPYKLERRTSHGWRWINRRQAWTMPLLFLEPGETSRPEPIAIYRVNPKARCPDSLEPCCLRVPLRPALYRVTKGFTFGARHLTARATFRVLDKPTGTAE
jgi:hypothetical protein